VAGVGRGVEEARHLAWACRHSERVLGGEGEEKEEHKIVSRLADLRTRQSHHEVRPSSCRGDCDVEGAARRSISSGFPSFELD
jgi:hypothetical protein